MIRVAVYRDGEGQFRGFVVKGHSRWGPKGFDIVCAGVAALTQAAALGLMRLSGARVKTEARDGFLECRLVEPVQGAPRERVDAIVGTMVLGLREIAAQYPDHVQVRQLEVEGV